MPPKHFGNLVQAPEANLEGDIVYKSYIVNAQVIYRSAKVWVRYNGVIDHLDEIGCDGLIDVYLLLRDALSCANQI